MVTQKHQLDTEDFDQGLIADKRLPNQFRINLVDEARISAENKNLIKSLFA